MDLQGVQWRKVAEGILSPEGPAADSAGNVYVVSRWTGRVLRVSPDGQAAEVVQTGGKPQAVALADDGTVYVADAKNYVLYRLAADGATQPVVDAAAGGPLLGPNDLVIAGPDAIYLTDPGLDMQAPGRVLHVNPRTGEARILVEGLLFPNGVALTDDGRFLLVAESSRHRVLRYPLRDAGLRLGEAEVFYQFDDHYPDGMAFDAAGNLLVARHGSGCLEVIDPQGRRIASAPVGGRGCTNCVFGGPDFRTLYVTEDDQQALLAARWPVPGQRRFSRSRS
jgi:gluconolactonase